MAAQQRFRIVCGAGGKPADLLYSGKSASIRLPECGSPISG